MQNNPSLYYKLLQLLRLKKSKSYYAKRLGVSEKEIDELLKEIRTQKDTEVGNYISALEELVVEVNNEKGTIKSIVETTFEPKDDLELAKLHKINLDKYKISNYWTKQKSNGKFTSSVFATLKQPKDYSPEDFAKFLENYIPNKVVVAHNLDIEERDRETVDIEISIADFHLAKKTLEDEDIETKKEQYIAVLSNLVGNVMRNFRISKVVFPISNDFFHTDNWKSVV